MYIKLFWPLQMCNKDDFINKRDIFVSSSLLELLTNKWEIIFICNNVETLTTDQISDGLTGTRFEDEKAFRATSYLARSF